MQRLQFPEGQVFGKAKRQHDAEARDAKDRRKEAADETVPERGRFSRLESDMRRATRTSWSVTHRRPSIDLRRAVVCLVTPIVLPRRHAGHARHNAFEAPEERDLL